MGHHPGTVGHLERNRQIMQEGGALRFLRWDILSKHVELMIEIVYLVWGIYMLIAARKPLSNLSFINFTRMTQHLIQQLACGQRSTNAQHLAV